MASELKVDKFTGVTTAGSISVTGEGGSTTTNLQQGLCKAWFKFNQDTPSVLDSFNTSSVNDDATGVHNGAFTTAMSNANYANSCMKQAELTNADCTEYTTGVNSTLLVKRNDIENGSPRDAANTNTLTFGDLA
jgi:hypothetical protein